MPTDPVITITNSPRGAKRVVQCRFEHEGLTADIVIQDAFEPEVSPGLETLKAQRILASFAKELLERYDHS